MDYKPAELTPVRALSIDGLGTLSDHDGVLLVAYDLETCQQSVAQSSAIKAVLNCVQAYAAKDKAAMDPKEAVLVQSDKLPVVLAALGPLCRDHDDVRRYGEATGRAMKRAIRAGSIKRPLLLVQPPPLKQLEPELAKDWALYEEVALLAALAELHDPLEARETQARGRCIENISILGTLREEQLKWVLAVEEGRRLARDIGGADPERMSAINAAEAIKGYFSDKPSVQVRVIDDADLMKKEYPLLAAVARASLAVPRHAPRIVWLEYRSSEPSQVQEELLMVGKGITYDTGGADLKVNGHMVGMSRDKCGAAALAGFMASCAQLQPKHLNITIALALVRNSIGADAYVSDELIRSRAGVRVRIGNTDAEGRMVMADLLAEMKERAMSSSHNSHITRRLFTCATLTGHVGRAYGPYAAAIENGPARMLRMAASLQSAGQQIGDCFEVSTLRREDFDFVQGKSACEDVIQANSLPSTMTARGHQFPAAFLMIASGLDKHGLDAPRGQRIPYTHLDIAAAAEESFPLGRPTGTPIAALATAFLRRSLK